MAKTPSVSRLVIRGLTPRSLGSHVYVSGDGVLSTGDQQWFPNGAFIIEVSLKISKPDEFFSSLKRIVRNSLSAYPIVDIEDGGDLPFDLKAWLRDSKQDL